MIIRASSLPRILLCPASRIAPGLIIDSDGRGAKLGRLLHAQMAEYLSDQTVPTEESTNILIEREGLKRTDIDEIRMLYNSARKIWFEEFSGAVELVRIEKKLSMEIEGFILQGTADVICKSSDERILILDYKSGRLTELDFDDQLKGYLLLAGEVYPEVKEKGGVIATLFIRDMRIEFLEVSPEELEEWRKRLVHAITVDPPPYNPSYESCRFCPKSLECEARMKLAQNAVEIFKSDVPAKNLLDYYDQSKMLEKALETYKAKVKDFIEENGTQELPDGRVLEMTEQTVKTIQPDVYGIAKAFGVPEAMIETEYKSIFKPRSVDKKALEKLAVDLAPKDMKKQARKDIMFRLEAEGVVNKSVRRFPKAKRKR